MSGLPPTFDLDIPRHQEGPVQLEDYLDAVESQPPTLRVAQQRKVDDSKVIELPRVAKTPEEAPPVEVTDEREPDEDTTPKKRRKREPVEGTAPKKRRTN